MKIIFTLALFSFLIIIIKCNLDQETIKNVLSHVEFYRKANIPTEYTNLNKNFKPKITIIIPVYNEEDNILTLLRSIQYQTLKELEILFIDDCSTDNTNKILKDEQKKDGRIRIIKNKKNRGILYNRIYGVFESKGKYIGYIDGDDCYCNENILEISYKELEKNNIDFLQFESFFGLYNSESKKHEYLSIVGNNIIKNKILKQPLIKKSFTYLPDSNITLFIFDKIYNKNILIKIADFIGEDIWNEHIIYSEDFLTILSLVIKAKTFLSIKDYGVWHWDNNAKSVTNTLLVQNRITKQLVNPKLTNKKINDILFMYEIGFDRIDNDKSTDLIHYNIIKSFYMMFNQFKSALSEIYYKERMINLIQRYYNWKYISSNNKKEVKQIGINILNSLDDINKKYINLLKIEKDEDNIKNNKKNKSTKKNKK